MNSGSRDAVARAAAAVAEAEGMIIGAGAGMGVDSGLPDFRGNQGFWEAYPPMARLGISFVEMANPEWFDRDPELAWGFYGHRLHLYRDTRPHAGFGVLLRWAAGMQLGSFVFTSNVDGQFQRGGFDESRVVECHGSIHHLQCAGCCTDRIWSAESTAVDVDPSTFRARPPLPSCPACGGVARPNVLMFGDWGWHAERSAAQQERLADWIAGAAGRKLVVVELGAGTAVPTVRSTCERLAGRLQAGLVRINVREAFGPGRTIAVASGAREALARIDALLQGAGGS